MLSENEQRRAFRHSARRFFEDQMAPLVDQAEETGKVPRDFIEEVGKEGYFGIGYPESVGGSGGDTVSQCIWIEEAARVCAGLTSALMIQGGLGVSPIFDYGSEYLIESYVRPAIRGELLGAFALTEPGAGSDVLAIRTRAMRDGDGYRISGEKMFITNAPACDYLILAAYTRPDAKSDGISLFVVDRAQRGVHVSKLDKHGHWSAETGQVSLEDVRVPAENLIGEEGSGYGYLLSGLEGGRIVHAARSLGVATAAYDSAVEYAKQREAFGRKLVGFQSMRFRLSRMALDLQTIRLHTYSAAEKHAQGEGAKVESSMAKLIASELAVDITMAAMNAHGGYGYMREFPVERFHRDAMLYPVTEGTNDIQLEVIARRLGIGA